MKSIMKSDLKNCCKVTALYCFVLLCITTDEHLNFNDQTTNVCKGANRKFNTLSRMSSLLHYQQKKVVSNSFIIGHNQFIASYLDVQFYQVLQKNQQTERSLQLCHNDYTSSFHELLSKQDLVNIHMRNIQHLMIEIFKCLKDLYRMKYLC